jgi:hypothetical protein
MTVLLSYVARALWRSPGRRLLAQVFPNRISDQIREHIEGMRSHLGAQAVDGGQWNPNLLADAQVGSDLACANQGINGVWMDAQLLSEFFASE